MTKKKRLPQPSVRKKIIAFLDKTAAQPDTRTGGYRCGMKHRTGLVLATSYKDAPRATALEFFHEGLTLYVFGVPGGKIANIKRNPRVSAFIYEQPMDHSVVQNSLQIFGSAELITVKSNRRLFREKMRKWNMRMVMEKLLEPMARQKGLAGREARHFMDAFIDACSFIKISPDHIIMKEYRPDFSMQKLEWKK